MNNNVNAVNKLARLCAISPFYRKHHINNDYFNELQVEHPLIEKYDIQKSTNLIVSDQYRNMDLNLLHIARTSGSTGEPLEVMWNTDDLMKSNLCLWRLRKEYYGINSSDKYISFHSIVYNKSKPLKTEKIMRLLNGTNLSFSKFHLSDSDIQQYLTEAREFQPIWLFSQSSVLLRLIEYLQTNKNEFPNSIRYIELTGEMVSKADEEKIKKFFDVPVANMYGCNEVNAIAYECPYGNMHIVASNVFVQLYQAKIKEKGFEGEIVVSSLHNSAFPIIGYRLGDQIRIIDSNACSCGSCNPIVDIIYGRKADTIKLESGKEVHPFLFTYCVEVMNSRLGNPVQQFKVYYNKNTDNEIDIIFRIYRSFHNWKESIISEFLDICNEVFKQHIKINICFTDDYIDLSLNGKYHFFEKKGEKS